jgi:hypothetical protein
MISPVLGSVSFDMVYGMPRCSAAEEVCGDESYPFYAWLKVIHSSSLHLTARSPLPASHETPVLLLYFYSWNSLPRVA